MNGRYKVSLSSRSDIKNGTWTSPASFTHIFEVDATNEDVYDRVVKSAIPHALEGSTCNFFAFGHTGSGKTHTIIGAPEQNRLGLYFLSAKRLCEDIRLHNEQAGASGSPPLLLALRLYELRQSKVYDLLDGRRECHAREGGDGKTHIRGETETLEGGKVRIKHIAQYICHTFEDVIERMKAGLQLRAQGVSSVHDESSRTHAILEMEIVTTELIQAREAVVEAQSELVPWGKRATDVYLEETMKSLIRGEDGQYKSNPDRPVDQEKIDEAETKKQEYEGYVAAAEERVHSAIASDPSIGGKLVFVDLAGAEYHKALNTAAPALRSQTAQERREGQQINTDLLALKEVIRAWAAKRSRVPYRSSTLTVVLREYFTHTGPCGPTMIVTASTAKSHFKATTNALQYGGLVGAA